MDAFSAHDPINVHRYYLGGGGGGRDVILDGGRILKDTQQMYKGTTVSYNLAHEIMLCAEQALT